MEQKYKPYVMYKITCNDNENLIYIGSTTNFRVRKTLHKSRCHNENYNECIKCNIRYYCRHEKSIKLCRKCDGRHLCKNEWCDNRLNKKYNDYCLRCFVYMFPE